jgi:hypothetical protein
MTASANTKPKSIPIVSKKEITSLFFGDNVGLLVGCPVGCDEGQFDGLDVLETFVVFDVLDVLEGMNVIVGRDVGTDVPARILCCCGVASLRSIGVASSRHSTTALLDGPAKTASSNTTIKPILHDMDKIRARMIHTIERTQLLITPCGPDNNAVVICKVFHFHFRRTVYCNGLISPGEICCELWALKNSLAWK